MRYSLPAGYTVRAAASADIPTLTEMLIAVDMHDFGKPDTEPEMITDDWSRSSASGPTCRARSCAASLRTAVTARSARSTGCRSTWSKPRPSRNGRRA